MLLAHRLQPQIPSQINTSVGLIGYTSAMQIRKKRPRNRMATARLRRRSIIS